MGFELGTVVIVAAVLIFYLRLIIIQRQKAKQARQAVQPAGHPKKKGKAQTNPVAPSFSIISTRRSDWVIAGIGALLMVLGILLNRALIPLPALQAFWWLPLALGIVGFSWAFR